MKRMRLCLCFVRSRMGSDLFQILRGHRVQYFNPRSRMGSDGIIMYLWWVEYISIHAPTWGATAKINKASYSKNSTRSDIAIPLPKSGKNEPFSPSFSPLFFYFDPHSQREGSGKILGTSPSRRLTCPLSRSSNQTISGSVTSKDGLAPICSTLSRYLLPRL